METILLVIAISILNIVCFFIGAKVGQKVVNKEPLKVPNPIEMVKSYEAKREEEKQTKEFNDMMEQIDNYDGNI